MKKFNENNKTDTSYRKNTSYKYPSSKKLQNKTNDNQSIKNRPHFRTIKELKQ